MECGKVLKRLGDQKHHCSHFWKMQSALKGKNKYLEFQIFYLPIIGWFWASTFISFCNIYSPSLELQLPLFLFYHWTVSFLRVASTSRCFVLFNIAMMQAQTYSLGLANISHALFYKAGREFPSDFPHLETWLKEKKPLWNRVTLLAVHCYSVPVSA